MSLPFEIIVDSPYSEFIDIQDERFNNKRSLCIANDFEDGKWRLSRFIDFIFDNLGENALNARERKALVRIPADSRPLFPVISDHSVDGF